MYPKHRTEGRTRSEADFHDVRVGKLDDRLGDAYRSVADVYELTRVPSGLRSADVLKIGCFRGVDAAALRPFLGNYTGNRHQTRCRLGAWRLRAVRRAGRRQRADPHVSQTHTVTSNAGRASVRRGILFSAGPASEAGGRLSRAAQTAAADAPVQQQGRRQCRALGDDKLLNLAVLKGQAWLLRITLTTRGVAPAA